MTINQGGGDMEMKPIPDYPNYAVTKDGRVWSYNRNKFLRPVNGDWGRYVVLSIQGMRFLRFVSRLVFTAFNGYEPERLYYKDGNCFNPHLDNLEGMTRVELNKKIHTGKVCPRAPKIFRVNIATGEKDSIKIRPKDEGYVRIHKALQRRSLTSCGYLYYYEGEKHKLINEIKAHIKTDYLALESAESRDRITQIKNHIAKNKKYLELLETN